jgi:hypothetical protein
LKFIDLAPNCDQKISWKGKSHIRKSLGKESPISENLVEAYKGYLKAFFLEISPGILVALFYSASVSISGLAATPVEEHIRTKTTVQVTLNSDSIISKAAIQITMFGSASFSFP